VEQIAERTTCFFYKYIVMIDQIRNLGPNESSKLLKEFMVAYLSKGFGVMNKSEIEILLYHIFRENGLLSGNCFDDSLALRISEAKARKLIYEAQVKYANREKDSLIVYLRESVGKCLLQGFISNGGVIKFAMEDKYLRVALNAHLRANNLFADSSFNKDIISLDKATFEKMFHLLVPNDQQDKVLNKMKEVGLLDSKTIQNNDLKSLINNIVSGITVEALTNLGKVLMF
jgi:hypothetical protein